MAQACSPKTKARIIRREIYQDLRDDTGRKMATKEGQAVYRTRAPGIEGGFGVIKHVMGVKRFLLRGIKNVRSEWGLVCLAFNLRKLLKRIRVENLDWRASHGLRVALVTVAEDPSALLEELICVMTTRGGRSDFGREPSWHQVGLAITN